MVLYMMAIQIASGNLFQLWKHHSNKKKYSLNEAMLNCNSCVYTKFNLDSFNNEVKTHFRKKMKIFFPDG